MSTLPYLVSWFALFINLISEVYKQYNIKIGEKGKKYKNTLQYKIQSRLQNVGQSRT